MSSPPVFRPGSDPELEEIEIELLLTAVQRRYGYDFRKYSPASLRRRVRRAIQTERVSSAAMLQERLLHDPEALKRFVTTLSVHVTAMFRDPPFFRSLREKVVPLLRTYPFIRIWHAGCSTGEEAYSLAVLLEEEGLLSRCRIYATDISDELLARARVGVFPLSSLREYEDNHRESGGAGDLSKYYLADSSFVRFATGLRKAIVFAQHNLVADGSFNEFHLILCRNVLIYFNEELHEKVHQLFYDSLARGGILALGMKESIRFTGLADRYEALDESVRLYRRVR